jgi:hypothetical protein
VTNNLVNHGMLRLKGAVGLAVGGIFTNNGVLDIMTWNGTLPAGFVNNGIILDRSLIRVTSPAVVEPDFQVTIQGYPEHTYQLQYRDDMLSGSWANIGSSMAGADAPITFTHASGATAGQRFYRVAVD